MNRNREECALVSRSSQVKQMNCPLCFWVDRSMKTFFTVILHPRNLKLIKWIMWRTNSHDPLLTKTDERAFPLAQILTFSNSLLILNTLTDRWATRLCLYAYARHILSGNKSSHSETTVTDHFFYKNPSSSHKEK